MRGYSIRRSNSVDEESSEVSAKRIEGIDAELDTMAIRCEFLEPIVEPLMSMFCTWKYPAMAFTWH